MVIPDWSVQSFPRAVVHLTDGSRIYTEMVHLLVSGALVAELLDGQRTAVGPTGWAKILPREQSDVPPVG